MKCPECVKEGIRSRVYSNGGSRTSMGFETYWDEDGEYHSHDPNVTTLDLKCSNGHRFVTRLETPCPNPKCNFGKDTIG